VSRTRLTRSVGSRSRRSAPASARASVVARVDAVQQPFEAALQDAERRAELVRHVRHQIAPLPISLGETLGHRVEGVCERAYRRRAVFADADRVVALGDAIGGVHHGAERPGSAAHDRDHRREDERPGQERQRAQCDAGRTAEAGALRQQPAGRRQPQTGRDDQPDQTSDHATEEACARACPHQDDGVRWAPGAVSPPGRSVQAGAALASHASVNR
jgi:hypothetical protein